jgi:replicative DNA helicase|tara:strand:- start:15457 stop:16941 length:1485 start_codon:yes stop_codon:yes gene_type:complete
MVRNKENKRKLEDLAAERAVLAGICQYGLDCYLDIDFVDSSYFTNEMNQIIFKCIEKSMKDSQSVELSSLLSSANQLGFYENISSPEEIGFIRSLFNFPINKENVQIHAAKISKLKVARDVKKTLKVCSSEIDKVTGDEDINDIISLIESPVLEVTSKIYQRASNKPEIIGDEVDEYIQYLKENKDMSIGISTGFPIYDEAIGGGLRRKCVDLIAARPKVGKSMFGDAVALHVAKNLNIPVLMLDTEMSKEDHLNRMLANLSNVEINRLAAGKFANNELDVEKVEKGAEHLKDIPYHYVSIAGQPFENILSIMRKWIYQEVGFDENGRTKDCLIIYDYLKLMNSSSISNSMQEFQVLGFQITQLHNFTVKYDVPCLSFVQLNRDGITKESTDVVSGSDRLIWLCTSFSIFKMKSDEEMADDLEENGNRKLVPIVARHGSGLDDGDYINMDMIGKFGKISEGRTRNELRKSSDTKSKGFDTENGVEQYTDISDIE